MNGLNSRLRAIPGWQITLGLALLGLGFLVAAQLAGERPRVRYTTQERSPLIETALELQSRQDQLKARILELREAIQGTEQTGAGSAALLRDLNGRLERARIAAGLIPLQGTGIVLRLEDSINPAPPDGNDRDYLVSAQDIRIVVDELWLAGAEAIAVSTERITTTTAVIDIGGSVLVNSAYLAPPYHVTALGPPDLFDRLSASAGFVEFVRSRAERFGIRLSFATPESVDIPAFAGTVNLRYARISATPAPSGSVVP